MRYVLVLALLLVGCDAYTYTKTRTGEPMRSHKITGKTEVLRRDFSGRDTWVVVSDSSASVATPVAQVARVTKTLPADDVAKIQFSGGLTRDGQYSLNHRFVLTLTNNSVWEVTSVDAAVEVETSSGPVMKTVFLAPTYSGTIPTGTMKTLERPVIGDTPTGRWQVVSVTGYPPQ